MAIAIYKGLCPVYISLHNFFMNKSKLLVMSGNCQLYVSFAN